MSNHVPLPKARFEKEKVLATFSTLQNPAIQRTITEHPFNHKIECICFTNSSESLDKNRKLFQFLERKENDCYKAKICLVELLEKDFLIQYIHSGSFVAISRNNRIDGDNVVAIDGKGQLLLSLCKDSYESSGLLGKPVPFPKSSETRYLVSIDLRAKNMAFDSKNYKRVKWSFSNILTESFDIAFAYFDSGTGSQLPFDGSVFKNGAEAVPGKPKCDLEESQLLVPDLIQDLNSLSTQNSLYFQSEVMEIVEWVGMACLGSDSLIPSSAQYKVDPYISIYSPPNPSNSKIAIKFSLLGILHPEFILSTFNFLLENFDDFVVVVWGFEDTPISWNNRKHGYLTSGENLYTHIINKKSNRWLGIRHCGPYDETS